jgi:hypothetical protein
MLFLAKRDGAWAAFGIFSKQTSDKASQLIKVIRSGDVYILAERNFIAFADLFSAEDHNWYLISDLRTFAETAGGENYFAW